MKKIVVFLCGVLLLASAAAAGPNDVFILNSPDLGDRVAPAQVYSKFGCGGGNISPALSWTPGPKGTKSYAVTVFDPDAPTGRGWWHWVLVNIPPDVTHLDAGAGTPDAGKIPAGSKQVKNDFGTLGYGGPCPPPGDIPHRYIFTVYALDVATLPVDTNRPGIVPSLIRPHILARSSITSHYSR